ncbi:serine hydrolase [Rheinheimera sp. YQF-2]|uniref:Serine hydrolase n=1 Tax=Rheinheimera lutimaris TaxID=2740584 RepID=A0A7Y5AP33_9GAMM|nr:serine hydrolase [Rheinheimera lutimaris]NRQ41584.1 serine hydrolase [Rheinheimera lutimaris]
MKQVYFSLLVISLTLLPLRAEPNGAAPDAVVSDLVQHYQQLNWFSGTVLVVKDNKVVTALAGGDANDETRTPITMQTRFDIGSVQKDLTAVLVLQAVDNKLLRLDDTLDKFSLGFANELVKNITVQHLLEHRSGFADIFTAEYRQNPAAFDSIDKKLAILKNTPLLFEPGTDRRYSNYGYIVLGAILEKVSGKSYWDLLQQNILVPARMTLTTEQLGQSTALATPYHFNVNAKRVAVAANEQEHKSAGGGGQMNVFELYGFYQQLFKAKRLLSTAGLQHFRALQKDQQHWVAFGGGKGVSTAVELDFANDVWLLVLANTDRLVAEEISMRLHSVFRSGTYPEVKLPPVIFSWRLYQQLGDKAFKARFESAYKDAGYQTFAGKVITDLARELVAAGDAQRAIPLFAYLTGRYPTSPEVFDGLAFGYFSAGLKAEARSAFDQATELKPGFNSQFNANNYKADAK